MPGAKVKRAKRGSATLGFPSPPKGPPPDLQLRRLMSAGSVNAAVEQFHVFSTTCTDADALYESFTRYRDIILSSMKLCRASPGANLEADILLINADWCLEEAGTTNNAHRLYLPEMRLRVRDKSIPSFEKPEAQDGVATYAIYASYQGKSGVAAVKDVSKSGLTTFFEAVDGMKYRAVGAGDMYKPVTGSTSVPYRTILSAPITVIREAHADPLVLPKADCIGVLNVTLSVAVALTPEDYAWAQTCASLVGSLHGSFFSAYAKLADAATYDHPNEVLLAREPRRNRAIERPSRTSVGATSERQPSAVAAHSSSQIGPPTTSGSASPPSGPFAPNGGSLMTSKRLEELRHARIEPWTTLEEEKYLIEVERLGNTEIERLQRNLTSHGFALIRMAGQRADAEIIEFLGRYIGEVAQDQNEVPGGVKSIKPVHEKPANSGDSARRLGAHVDGTQHAQTPAILIFQYVHGATYGAESTFWDAAQMFEELDGETRHRLLSALAKPDAGSCKKGALAYEGPLVRKCTPTSIAFRYRTDDGVLTVSDELKEYSDMLERRFRQRGLVYLPRAGDIAVFDNWRLLHGREEVGGSAQREHRRMWISEVHSDLRNKMHLGIRPIESRTMAEIDRFAASK